MDKIYGRNPVAELIKSGKDIDKLYINKEISDGSIKSIIGKAKDRNIIISYCTREKLDDLCETTKHQGVLAIVPQTEYVDISDILNLAKEKNEKPFIFLLDEIEDPHNLGAIIRTAKCAGAKAVIIPKRNTALVTSTVEKCSAGAVSLIPIVQVANLNNAIDKLKEHGFWVYGAEANGEQNYYDAKYNTNTLFVLGGENQGISKLTAQKCDIMVKINMKGDFNSLNVSNAAGILMFEFLRQQEV